MKVWFKDAVPSVVISFGKTVGEAGESFIDHLGAIDMGEMDSYEIVAGALQKKAQAAIDIINLAQLQAQKKTSLNAEVKRRVKVGVLSDPDKALSVGLGIYGATLSQQAKDWTAANIAASNATQLVIYDAAATLASVSAIDPIADTIWPDVTLYPLLMV